MLKTRLQAPPDCQEWELSQRRTIEVISSLVKLLGRDLRHYVCERIFPAGL